ncbi:MAG: hypothetical protein ABWZ98_01800 [Nakamurella sp.]
MNPTVFDRSIVDEALRSLPAHGWVTGRDRALLALSQSAALPYTVIAELLVGDVTVTGGIAVIRTSIGTVELGEDPNALLCGPCALSRWVHMLDMTAIYSDRAISAAVIARGVALSPHSPHACDSTPGLSEATRRSTLFPPVDQWGLLTAASTAGNKRPLLPSQHTPDLFANSRRTRTGQVDSDSRAERLERRARELVAEHSGS